MNENLPQALLRARLREQDVAAHLSVDPKTVRRWIEGRIPYPANRAALADLLHMNEADLWPRIASPLASRTCPDELVAVYPHRWAIPRETWAQFFASAEREIGILAYSAFFLAEDTGLLNIIAEKGRQGLTVRIALGDPESYVIKRRGVEEGIGQAMAAKVRNALALFDPLRSIPNIAIRVHRAALYNSIYRADESLLVNQHTFGLHAADAPVLRFQKHRSDEMADMYLDSLNRIWAVANS